MYNQYNKKAHSGSVILIIILILVIVIAVVDLWANSDVFKKKECSLDKDCADMQYCGSDFSCHDHPVNEKTVVVTQHNYGLASFFLTLGIIVAALIVKGDSPLFDRIYEIFPFLQKLVVKRKDDEVIVEPNEEIAVEQNEKPATPPERAIEEYGYADDDSYFNDFAAVNTDSSEKPSKIRRTINNSQHLRPKDKEDPDVFFG